MKKLLSVVLALAMVLAFYVPAMAAELPFGASDRTINIDGTNYLINDLYTTNTGTGNVRATIPNYAWDAAFETYTFDPDNIEGGVTFDPKYGFPLRASYRTPTDYFGEMNFLAKTYPDIVKMVKIGNTTGASPTATAADPNYAVPIYMLEICDAPGANDGRPAHLHFAGNHGNELPSNELTMNLAWYLITNYGKPGYEDITELLNTTRIFIVPITNVDGNIISMRNTSGRRPTITGTDMNRNWSYAWGSMNGASATDRGQAPNDAPETQALSNLYQSNQIVSSISGHTSGQILIYAWAGLSSNRVLDETVYGTVGIPILAKTGRELAALNMHHEQPSESLYPATGGLNDYAWGFARALNFTYEYGTIQSPQYMGFNRYMAYTNYNDANGNTRKIPLTYSSNANSRQPSADLTAPVAFVNNPKYYIGGYGDPEKCATVAEVQALGNLTGKIFMTPQGPTTAETANIIAAAQAQGAVGVIVSKAGTGAHSNSNTGATFYSPGNVSASITIPVAGTSKPYARDIYDKATAGENVTVTLKSTQDANVESLYWQWERHVASYMKSMSFATEYASHIKGGITDGNGNPLPGATLNLSLMVDGLLKHPGTYTGSGDNISGYGDNPLPVGSYEAEHTSVYNVEGSDFDWSVVPSQQPDPMLPSGVDSATKEEEHVNKPDYAPKDQIKDKDGNLTGDRYLQIPDRGYDITATGNGRYSDTKNVKVGDYQLTIEDVNFDLPVAISSDFTFNKSLDLRSDIVIPFTIHNCAEPGAVTAIVNGVSAEVVALGDNNYTATFNPRALGIKDVEDIGVVINFEGGAAHSALVLGKDDQGNPDGLTLTTDANLLKTDDYFRLNAFFAKEVNSNTAILTYKFDGSLFEYRGFTPAEGIAEPMDVQVSDGQVKITVITTGGYGITNFGEVLMSAKGAQTNSIHTASVTAEYVVKDEEGGKIIKSAIASTSFTTTGGGEGWITGDTDGNGVVDLIDLSNMVDWFGTTDDDANWDTLYIFFDFVKNGEIDIGDIAFVAKLIK